jgi:hypothetical protein
VEYAFFPYKLSDHAFRQIAKREIRLEWIVEAIENPLAIVYEILDKDLRHGIIRIPGKQEIFLRVVYNFKTDPYIIVTAFIDRRLKGQL